MSMSSVDVGKQQLEKKKQREGCGSEEEAKLRKMRYGAEDSLGLLAEVSDEHMDEAEVSQTKEKMFSLGGGEGSSSEEVDQPEKKRPGEGEVGASDEEEPKRQKVEDHKDDDSMSESELSETGYGNNEPEAPFYGRDFSPNDSDDDCNEDFTSIYKTVERGYGPDGYASQEENEDGRYCLEVPRCHKFLHKSEFYGLPVVEFYKVKLILNEERNPSLTGKLYGAIEVLTSPENPDPISYFTVNKENAFPIHLTPGNNNINLPLCFPGTKALTNYTRWLEVKFAFKFEYENDHKAVDLFEEHGFFHASDEARDDGASGNHEAKSWFVSVKPNTVRQYREDICKIQRYFLAFPNSDIIRVAAYYGVYDGVWATVDVNFSKEGVTKYYGFIYARPCIFFRRIRLLSLQQQNQMRDLPKSGDVKLERPVVAIPSFCSLVIAVLLYDQDGNQIIRDKAFFKALPPGRSQAQRIGEGHFNIGVKWNCYAPHIWTPWIRNYQ
ncbi:hypothetical protein PTKIN_Ptkin03bG0056500 [Pterospermum kingtungense]